jgi:uncharacterized protein YeaO (DUF488 family)
MPSSRNTNETDDLIRIKRAYDKPALSDGARILVEGKWPRGLGKDAARVDHWFPALAPSETLARWFTHTTSVSALQRKYFNELRTPAATEALEHIYNYLLREKTITLLYAGDDPVSNGAILLKELLDGHRMPPNNTGPAKAAAAGGRVRAAARRPRR